jgi:filamentous hemagglutinin family protein
MKPSLLSERCKQQAGLSITKGLSWLLTGLAVLSPAPCALANPTGMTVVQGSASTTTSGSHLTITTSQNTFLNWQSFNIGLGQTTTFQQPSAGSVVWNQINGGVPSQIWGNLNANGVVVLMNSSGFYFGPDSHVSAAGFVASTATVPPLMTGGSEWEFNGAPPSAAIVNYGTINVQQGGSLFLIGSQINNRGLLNAPGGTIGLGAGQEILVSDRPDGHGLNIAVNLPAGSVNNAGHIIADGGSIVASAQTINQNGLIQANSVREQNGVIELVASDAINLGANSTITAQGDSSAPSDGGQITIRSGNTFSDTAGSVISAAGGGQGGNGGAMEISAPNVLSLNSHLDASAQPGYTAGRLSLDPDYIILSTTGTDSAGNGTVTAGSNPGTTLNLNVNTAFSGFSQITLQANYDITLAQNTAWNLSQSTGQNSGLLTLLAGRNIILQDGSSISDANNWSVTMAAGVNNFTTGAVTPGFGSIYLNGGNGLANGGSIQTTGGAINLTAGLDIQTGNGSLTDVNGNPFSLASAAGNIALNAGNNIQISGATVETTAGGNINLTAGQNVNIDTGYISAMGGGAVNAIATLGTLTVGTGNIQADTGAITLTSGQDVDINGSVASGTGSITLTAGHDINTGQGSLQDANFNQFSVATGAASTGSLTLNAGHDIQITGGGFVETTAGAILSLTAGQDIDTAGGFVSALGGGKITSIATAGNLNIGSGFFQTDSGNIALQAAQNITVGSGAVTTIGGGSINAYAQAGSVNTGTDANGYLFHSGTGAQVNLASLGGISTGAGGNVTIVAGQNVTSYLPNSANSGDAGSGAFGPHPGNVTILAGGNVTGHYVVADGIGIIGSGRAPVNNAGTSQSPLALSLVDGSWSVDAVNGIFLQEVRNPNGIFNLAGNVNTPTYHQFTYGADASVTLTANTVELSGANLPRDSGDSIPIIYPPELIINAGAGGVLLDRNVILFPSPQGLLDINSIGSLIGPSAFVPTQLIMSDSGHTQFTSAAIFGSSDHAPVPVHLNNETTCELNIGGNMNNIFLVVPEPAQVTVGGSMNNCAFLGQNLHANDVTSINVAGDIFNFNNYSTITLNLAATPDLLLLTQAYGTDLTQLYNTLTYNPVTGLLAVQGQMSQQELAALFSFQIQALNALGQPAFNGNGQPILETVHLFDQNNPAVAAALDSLQAASQLVPSSPGAGYTIGGPGSLFMSARNIDLGDTLGIVSVGPKNNNALAPYCYNPLAPWDAGAAININLSGNLTMFSTTISTLAGGAITIDAGGSIVAGSSLVSPGDTLPRGIFTVARADVNVTANGDINLDGSRIAAYDGGNVSVLSRTGDVDAGSGGTGACTVQEIAIVPVLNPMTGAIISYNVESYAPTIPGSGILATTFPPPTDSHFPASRNTVGNITVDTPEGNIIANQGGVIQLALNGVSSGAATVTLDAGSPGYSGTINATGSGVIGANVNLSATAGISGVVVASQNLNVTSQQNVSVTAVAAGEVSVSAVGSISGTIVGVGGITASSGTAIQASLLSQNVSTSGGTASGQVGFAAANTAGATSQAASSDDRSKAAVTSDATDVAADDEKKRKKHPVLARIGRVTVFLPGKADK